MKERENMPLVSAAAHKQLSNFPDYHKQVTRQSEKPVLSTCKTCGQIYNIKATEQVLTTCPTIENFDYSNLCLNCIKEASRASKISKLPRLKELKETLDRISKEHLIAHNKYKAISKEFKALDTQENLISHEQQKISSKKPAASKKPSTDAQTNTALAMKILAKLSPEMQAAILANLKNQSS